jgi:hypothetical protein
LLEVTPSLSVREFWEPCILFIPIYPNARTTVWKTVVLLPRPEQRTLENQSELLLALLVAVVKTVRLEGFPQQKVTGNRLDTHR